LPQNSDWQTGQSAFASAAQVESQAIWQQYGSAAQTIASHCESLQPIPKLAKQQLVCPAQTAHISIASFAQN
jgi:hypothetical protein